MLKRWMRSDDSGFAMVAVLGIAAVVTVVAIGAYVLASEALHDSVRNRGETRAFQVANSGLELELATFNAENLGDYPKVGSTPDGQYTVNVLQRDTFEYVIISRGVAESSVETVTQRFFYIDIWDMNMGAGSGSTLGGGSGWNGNANITGPFYMKGNMEWSGNAKFEGGPLFIKGTDAQDGHLDVSGSGTFGEAKPIKAYIAGTPPVTGFVNQVHLDGPARSSVPDIVLPWVDDEYLDAKYALAVEESANNIMGGSSSSTVNNEVIPATPPDPGTYTTVIPGRLMGQTVPPCTSTSYKYRGSGPRAAVGAGNNAMSIGSVSFGAWEGNGYAMGSGLHDDFAYDAANGTLYVDGTVFIDGPVHIEAPVNNYVGNGTLVCNGDVVIDGRLVPRDGLSVSSALGVVTPGNLTLHRDQFTGAVFCNGTFLLDGTHTDYIGTVLAGQISATAPNVSLTTNPTLKDVLPESMPGAGGGIVFPGNWSRQ